MASSGQVTISTQSVDYGGGRGAVWLTNVVSWNVDNSGNISFGSVSSSDNAGGTWGICGTTTGYGVILEPQVSYDGVNWISLDSKYHEAAICPSLTNTIAISTTLIGQLGSYHLNGNCSLRFLYYANRAPAPSPSLPNSFPSSSYSAAVQVPVQVDVSWTARLRYNANGGSGAPGDQTKTTSGNSTTITVSSTRPTRANHRFDGWATSSTGNVTNLPGSSFTINKDNPTRTLYAHWTEYYRPGERKMNGTSRSLNRSGGVCDRHGYGEMKTLAGGVETSDPPSRKHSGTWYNQRRIGAE